MWPWILQQRLLAAFKKGDATKVYAQLKAGASPNVCDNNGNTLAHIASSKHKNEVLHILLAFGADVRAKNKGNYEPMHACVMAGRSEVTIATLLTLQVLVSFGATWDTKCDEIVDSVDSHIDGAALRICVLLWAEERARGRPFTDVPVEDVQRGVSNTILHITSRVGLLGEFSDEVQIRDPQALLRMSEKGDVEAVRELLTRGDVDVNTPDWDGVTPLHKASRCDHAQIVELLLQAGADPNAKDQNEWTPLHCASLTDNVHIVELLLNAEADPNASNENDWTPLHHASRKGHLQVAVESQSGSKGSHESTSTARWLSVQADVDRKTALHVAVPRAPTQLIELLLKGGADPNVVDDAGDSPLHCAVYRHNSKVTNAILSGHADIHAKNKEGFEPLHECIRERSSLRFSNDTLETVQVFVLFGATWDTKCDDMVASRHATPHAPAIRICVSLWTEQLKDGMPLSDVPIEVVLRGPESTQTYIDDLKVSLKPVQRLKACLVGCSCAGKTSYVKSITSEVPHLEPLDDRTMGIDHFPLRFRDYEVTFWDFAGQDAYQVAHSPFFSPRTLYFVFIDLDRFFVAYMQAVIFADDDLQERRLLDEYVEQTVVHWIRMIIARQPDAEFVFVATKEDLAFEDDATKGMIEIELRAALRRVASIVEETRNRGQFGSSSTNNQHGNEPDLLLVNATSTESIHAAREQVEKIIVQSKRSFAMPKTYSQVLEAVMQIREEAKDLNDDVARVEAVFAGFDMLQSQLRIDLKLCKTILETLHDLGDVLWYKNLDIEVFSNTVILDPMLLIQFIRHVINHKFAGLVMSHEDLQVLPFWKGLSDKIEVMEGMKKVMEHFHLVYSAKTNRVMTWDSDLVVPTSWWTKKPASLEFGGAILNTRNATNEACTRVDWEYHFAFGIPPPLFDYIVVSSVVRIGDRDIEAGPDWILYEGGGNAACRIMIDRDSRSRQQTIRVEAVIAKDTPSDEVENLWVIFRLLVGAFMSILGEFPG